MTTSSGNPKPAEPVPVKYVPKRKLRAVGSYYSVYEATQVGLDRPVELRVLNCKLQAGSPELARFQHEFSTLGALDHPHLIRVLDVGVMADHVFYVTDLRNSKSFADMLDKGREFTFEESITVVRAVLSAVGHLHRKNVVHRDLSATTIFLDQDTNVPYIAEFSLIKNQSLQGPGLTQRGIPTLKALAKTPEAIKCLPYDHRTDLYHAGGFFYRLLTNQEAPLSFAGPGEIADMCHPRSVNARVPAELDAVVVKALRASPDDRYQSAEEFLVDVERVADKLAMKSMLSEMVETTLTDNRVVRQLASKKPGAAATTLEMSRDEIRSALQRTAQAAPAGNLATSTLVMQLPGKKQAAAQAPDAMVWIQSHREYLYLLAGPAVVVLVLSVLFALRGEPDAAAAGGGTTAGGRPRPSAHVEARDYGPDVKKVAEGVLGMPTTKESFHQRWYLLDNWIKQLTAAQVKLPFTAADLVSVRINYYRDEQEAAGKLDALYEKAGDYISRPPKQ